MITGEYKTNIMHTEYEQYQHHYTMLAITGKTINWYYYKGHTIEEKVSGVYVDGIHRFCTMQQAKIFIDDKVKTIAMHTANKTIDDATLKQALDVFSRAFNCYTVTGFANCLVYKTSKGLCDAAAADANKKIAELALPLVAVPTDFPTKDSFVIQKQLYAKQY